MQKYKASAFSFENNIGDSKVAGNPATIFILENDEEFSRDYMSEKSKKEQSPISCFIKNKDGNDYEIYYYNLDGSQAYMCGHGTIATTFILNKIFHEKNQFSRMGRFDFYFDKIPFGKKIRNNHIVATIGDDGKVFIEQKIHNYMQIFERDEDIKSIMSSINLQNKDVVDIFKAVELDDLIFVLSDNHILRDLKPNFKDMTKTLEKMRLRNFCVTAVSDLQDFTFESRVFVPHDGLNEDIACGSSNLTISKYWKNEMNINNFKILFPYHMNYDDKIIGGVQFVNINDDLIKIGGYCSEIKI